jgi:hypothetical protein
VDLEQFKPGSRFLAVDKTRKMVIIPLYYHDKKQFTIDLSCGF